MAHAHPARRPSDDALVRTFAGGARGTWRPARSGLPDASTPARPCIADLDAAAHGHASPVEYTAVVERTRGALRPSRRRCDGRRASRSDRRRRVFAGLVAAALPDGAEVLCAEGDFSSMVMPVRARRSRHPRAHCAPSTRSRRARSPPDTWSRRVLPRPVGHRRRGRCRGHRRGRGAVRCAHAVRRDPGRRLDAGGCCGVRRC